MPQSAASDKEGNSHEKELGISVEKRRTVSERFTPTNEQTHSYRWTSSQHMRILSQLLLAIVALMFVGCTSNQPHDEISLLVTEMRNSDVDWHGDYFGLRPEFTGPTQKLMDKPLNKIAPLLIDALKDKNRYIAAHVVLSQASHSLMRVSAATWNGFRIELLANGQSNVPNGQQAMLLQKWTDWRATNEVMFRTSDN